MALTVLVMERRRSLLECSKGTRPMNAMNEVVEANRWKSHASEAMVVAESVSTPGSSVHSYQGRRQRFRSWGLAGRLLRSFVPFGDPNLGGALTRSTAGHDGASPPPWAGFSRRRLEAAGPLTRLEPRTLAGGPRPRESCLRPRRASVHGDERVPHGLDAD